VSGITSVGFVESSDMRSDHPAELFVRNLIISMANSSANGKIDPDYSLNFMTSTTEGDN